MLLDLERIAPCLPGAQLQEIEGDEYRGVVKVKVGPITAQYKGTAKLESVDDATHTAMLVANGRDTRGQGNASATIKLSLIAEGDGTRVDVDTDLSITGKVAQFGRGVMADVSTKLLAQFVENLERDVLSRDVVDLTEPEPRRTPSRRGSRAPIADDLPTSSSPTRWPPRPSPRPRRPGTARRCARSTRARSRRWTCSRWVGRRSCAGWPRSPGSCWSALVAALARAAPAALTVGCHRSAPRPPAGSRIEPVFDPTGPVLGIDPGVSRCGYGAVAGRSASRARLGVPGGRLRGHPHLARPGAARAARAGSRPSSRRSSRSSRPSALAVERVLFQVNVRTAMSVGQASGLALATAARAGIPVAQYSPNEVKLAVAGLRRRGEGRGAGDGRPAAEPARAARVAGRRRRARPRAVPPVGRAAARDARRRQRARTPATTAVRSPAERSAKDGGTR